MWKKTFVSMNLSDGAVFPLSCLLPPFVNPSPRCVQRDGGCLQAIFDGLLRGGAAKTVQARGMYWRDQAT